MKSLLILLFMLTAVVAATAQLKVKANCPDFEVDILDGKVNGIRPDIADDRLKLQLPCFTSSTELKDNAKCGTSVLYKDKDIYFFTERDYIEIGPKFKGKLSIPLIGAPRKSLFQWLGNPKMKDDKWSAFQTSYGIIVLYFDPSGKVNKIQLTTKGTDTMSPCE